MVKVIITKQNTKHVSSEGALASQYFDNYTASQLLSKTD